jgi:hypothetical protein
MTWYCGIRAFEAIIIKIPAVYFADNVRRSTLSRVRESLESILPSDYRIELFNVENLEVVSVFISIAGIVQP